MTFEELLNYTAVDVLKDRPAGLLQDDGSLLRTNSIIIQLNVAKDKFLKETHVLTKEDSFLLEQFKESYIVRDIIQLYEMNLFYLDDTDNEYKYYHPLTGVNDRLPRRNDCYGAPMYFRSYRKNNKTTQIDFTPIPDDTKEYQVRYSCAYYAPDFPYISKKDSPSIIDSKLRTEVQLDTDQALLLAQHVLFESATNRDLEQFSQADRDNARSKWLQGINDHKHEKYNQTHGFDSGASNPWR